MKAIIIAAGRGKRMNHLTEELPKCLLPFEDQSLMEIQINILRSLGIQDIYVIKGYQSEKINFPELNYYINDDYLNNNILESLFYAEPEIQGDVIIHYCDILFGKEIVETLLTSQEDISIVVDVNWRANYIGRKKHPIEEAENVIFDADYYVEKIGKILDTDKNTVPGEFIGMLKLNARGAEIFRKTYHSSRDKYKGGPFQRAQSIKRAYITDMIQELVDNAVKVKCIPICNGWQEIDTIEDFEKAIRLWKNMIE